MQEDELHKKLLLVLPRWEVLRGILQLYRMPKPVALIFVF